jgi:adenylate kinase
MKPIVLLGSPGSGKGTQGRRIAEYFDVPHISTGDMLRDHVQRGTVIGYCVKETLSKGLLVPDELMTDLITSRLRLDDTANGYVLDGFPRTVPQAEWFYAHYQQPIVFLLDVPEAEVLRRIAVRGESRPDDQSVEVVLGRLHEYEQFTEPIIGYYEREAELYRVDGTQSSEEIFDWIRTLLISKDAIAYG